MHILTLNILCSEKCDYFIVLCWLFTHLLSHYFEHIHDMWIPFVLTHARLHGGTAGLWLFIDRTCGIRSWVWRIRKSRNKTGDVSLHTSSPYCHTCWPRYTAMVHICYNTDIIEGDKTLTCWQSIRSIATLNSAPNSHVLLLWLYIASSYYIENEGEICISNFYFHVSICNAEPVYFLSSRHWPAVLSRCRESEPASQSSPLLWPGDVQQSSAAGEGRSVTSVINYLIKIS